MRDVQLLLLLPAALALLPAAGARDIALVVNGKSTYSIALPSQASPSERRGALELQRFLEEMSGARLPIVPDSATRRNLIFVGRGAGVDGLRLSIAFDQLGPEGFALKTSGRHLVIAGGRQRGTMYGVYTFLEKLGCRWYARDASVIPKKPSISVPPLDETQRPAFEYREPFLTEAFDKNWAARNRTNGDHSELDESTGGKVRYYPFVHSFYEMIPPEKYFATHPEYFSLIDGKRRVERGQLCLTNPEVLRLGVEAVERWIREHPDVTIFSVSQNDWEGWCECEQCARVEREEGGVHSGPMLRYVNALAEQIGQRHPDKLIDTLAYWYTEAPPRHARPRPNVRIRLCPIGACEAHPYEKCERNAYFMRNLREWSKITNQLYIWHYNTNFSHYLLPFPDFDELAADIPMYRRHGVVGLFMQGAYAPNGGGENAELRSWVLSRLLWDPNIDSQAAVREFHHGYYGKAAAPMLEYFNLLHQQVRAGKHIWIFDVPDYSPAFVRDARALFAKADASADTEPLKRRVRKARLPIDYTEYLHARQFHSNGEWYQPSSLPDLKDRFSSLLASLRDFGITSIHEGRDLAWDESEFAKRMKPYRVQRVDGEGLRAEIVPELTGRVIRLLETRNSLDLLDTPNSGDRGYPDVGGLVAFAHPDFHGVAWPATWTWDNGRLRGTLDNGLRLSRILTVEGSALRTELTAVNESGAPLEVALQSRGEFKVTDMMVAPGDLSSGSLPCQPSGEWRLTNRVVVRAPAAELDRCSIVWSAKGPGRRALVLWSKKQILRPGESIRLHTDYEVR